MGAWQLCGVAPLLLRNKLLGFVGKEQRAKKPKAPRNKKKKTKGSATSASVRKLNGVAEKFVRKQRKKKHKIKDIRRKALIFRDYLDLFPCNPSATVNEILICTMKDIQRLWPNMQLDTAITDLEEAPLLKILRCFCNVMKNLGDLWTNNGEWMVKCKYNASDKLSQDQLEQLAQAMLEDLNKLAGERMFDMMDEDDHTSECSHPENAFGRTPSGTYSEGKACHSSSPATPTSVLPQMSRASSKRSYSPPLVVPVSVHSMQKLSPIDIKRLSLHVFSHAEAAHHEDGDSKNIQQVETSPESKDEPEVKTEDTDESSPESRNKAQAKPEDTDNFSPESRHKPNVMTEGSDESSHGSEMLKDTMDRYSDVISISGTPTKEGIDEVPGSDSNSISGTPEKEGTDKVPHSEVKSTSTPKKPGIDVVPQSDAKSKSGTPTKQVIDVVPPPAWLHKLKPSASPKENPLPIPSPKTMVLSPSQTMLSPPKDAPSPPTPPPPPPPPQPTVTKESTIVGSPPPSTPVSSPKKSRESAPPPQPSPTKGAPPPPPQLSPIKGAPPPPPPQPLSPMKGAPPPPVSHINDAPPPPVSPKKGAPPPPVSPKKGAPPPPPPPPLSPIKGAPPPPPPLSPMKGGPPPPPSPIKGGPPPPPGLGGDGNKRLGKTASKLRRSAQMANLYRSLKGKVEGSFPEPKAARPGKISAAPGGKQGMADALAEMTKRSAYFLQIEEDVKHHEKSIMELKKSITCFESANMDELYTFHKFVESILEKLSDETQVLARFEDFPTKKLETIRMAAALYSKLVSISNTLRDWQTESPVGKVLEKLESYFSKVKQDVDALERTKADEMKKFKNYKITFDFSILLQIKEQMVDVSSSCMELALKERRDSMTAESRETSPTAEQQKKGSAKVLWKAFQFAYRVYTFAGGHDDRADQLTREIANELQTDPDH